MPWARRYKKVEEHKTKPHKPVRSQEERNKIAEANYRLIHLVVRKFFTIYPQAERWYSRDDAYADGYLGLMRAAELYKDDRNVKFSTYAFYWILQSIQRGYEKHGFIIQAPTGKRPKVVTEQCLSEDDEDSFDKLFSVEEDPDAVTSRQDAIRIVHEALTKLHSREARVLKMVMQGMLLQEIGDREGVSRERIRQIRNRAMHNLAKYLITLCKEDGL